MAASPPTMFWIAAVAMVVRGHRQFAATPSSRYCSATPRVSMVMPNLLIVYGACAASQRRSGSSGGERVSTCGFCRLEQVRQRGRGEHESAAHVDVHHQVEALDRQVADVVQVDRGGVVQHQVDAAEPLDRALDRSGDLRLVADVADDRQYLATSLLDFLGGGVDRAGQAWVGLVRLGDQRDVRAVLRDAQRDRQADAPTAAGHQQRPPGEGTFLRHVFVPFCSWK